MLEIQCGREEENFSVERVVGLDIGMSCPGRGGVVKEGLDVTLCSGLGWGLAQIGLHDFGGLFQPQ